MKLYAHDKTKIEANRATAGERRSWNDRVQSEKERHAADNYRAFVPRKASHKQGYKLAFAA
jgi:hypothetical protein